MIDVRFSTVGEIDASRRDDPEARDFERVGGADGLRAIVDDFLNRVFDDAMIGYLFTPPKRARVRKFEYQWAAAHLGGDVRYDGRPLGEAHRAVKVFDGHFARRMWLLRETLVAHDLPEDVIARWIAHDEAQRDEVMFGSCR